MHRFLSDHIVLLPDPSCKERRSDYTGSNPGYQTYMLAISTVKRSGQMNI